MISPRIPRKTANLYASRRALADGLRQKLDQFRQRLAPAQSAEGTGGDSERVEALRSLGYVAVSVPVKQAGRSGLPDPKDKVQLFNRVLLALQATDAGALSKSNAILGEVIREEPDLFIAHYSLGVNRLKSGEFQAALEDFARARALNPSFELTELNRATALTKLGRADEAAGILQAGERESLTAQPAPSTGVALYPSEEVRPGDKPLPGYPARASRRRAGREVARHHRGGRRQVR